ncbi:MAG: lipoate--protein ligase family protein [Nitrospirae bacterium]|nr:lipoate--protein ligase family protein [Nitrospirota bacterium]
MAPEWRLIDTGPCSASYNMALDEAIVEAVRKKLSPPTLRFYQWSVPAVSIGYFQKISEINIDYCNRMGYPIIRRPTGGRAILHDSELTYSFSVRTDIAPFTGRLFDNYMAISKAIISGLSALGLDAVISYSKKRDARHKSPSCFESISYGEISINGQKFVGSAQRHYADCILQQGSILLDLNIKEQCKALNLNIDENPGGIGAIAKYNGKITINNLQNSLSMAFPNAFGIKLSMERPTQFELNLAQELEKEKYSTHEWNFRR